MNLTDLKELESYFADHFDTAFFPVLSEHYLLNGDLERAERVCEIGLDHDKDSVVGLFIYARVLMAKGDLKKAERCLKRVVDLDPGFFNGHVLLAEVQSTLGRSTAILKHRYDHILTVDPSNEMALRGMKSLNKKKVKKQRKRTTSQETGGPRKEAKPTPAKTPRPRKKAASPEAAALTELEISPQMATFTLVAVLKSQKLYEQALEVLAVMSHKPGADKKRMAEEKKSMMDFLKSREGD